jgi:predicted ATP-binding protein involved in virulence
LYSSERTFHLPVVAYYGTDRAVRSEVLRVHRDTKKNESRFQALAGALDSSSRFREGLEWFTRKEDEARREREDRGNLAYRLPELELVRQAIERVLGSNFSNPRTKIRPFRFVIDQKVNGVTHTLRMSQLSDGYRMMLGLVMDFARRMVQANPPTQSGGANPLDLPAIMLIDEVDLHLHPEWQQRVLSDLMRTFPNTQFIVTTHSPQVLSTVKRESIRVIDADGCTLPPYMTYGEPSGSVMHSTMGVDPQPPIPEKEELAQLTQLVDKGEYETPESHRLMTHLQSTLGEHNYQLQRLHRSIRRQEALK